MKKTEELNHLKFINEELNQKIEYLEEKHKFIIKSTTIPFWNFEKKESEPLKQEIYKERSKSDYFLSLVKGIKNLFDTNLEIPHYDVLENLRPDENYKFFNISNNYSNTEITKALEKMEKTKKVISKIKEKQISQERR